MMPKRLLVLFLGLTLAVAFAGVAAAQTRYDTPTLTVLDKNFTIDSQKVGTGLFRISLSITAGSSGAPAGFSVQWMKKSDYDALNGWAADGDPRLKYCQCYGPYVLNQWAGTAIMGSGETSYLQLGDLDDESPNAIYGNDYDQLLPGTQYVVRGYAEADGNGDASDYSSTLTVQTTVSECTQGFWKTHGPAPCHQGNNADVWPASCFPMTLGTPANASNTYNQAQICSILQQNPAGNGLVSLAHQLIATLLNGCSTSDLTPVLGTIAAANSLIGKLTIPPVGSGFLPPSSTSALTETLDDYNNGLLGGVANCPTPAVSTTWGRIKVLYR